MRRTLMIRRRAAIVLSGGLIASTGCIHNHYYGTAAMPVCEAPFATQVGAVCEVPQGSALVAASPGRVTTIGSPSRIVVNSDSFDSQPIQRGASRFAWRRSDDPLTTARIEGGVDEDTTTR
ncbi:MAG: hypothetical protein ABI353_21455 [Isosphaeraceae bacterium]